MGMKPRHMLMLAGLAISAWLALFGDKTPDDGIAAPAPVAAPVKAAAPVRRAPAAPAGRRSRRSARMTMRRRSWRCRRATP